MSNPPSDLDVYRSAAVLIEHHGEDAAIEAAMRADRMLAKGDLEGHRVWVRIGKAIAILTANAAPQDKATH